jgi:hypothetical protein
MRGRLLDVPLDARSGALVATGRDDREVLDVDDRR